MLKTSKSLSNTSNLILLMNVKVWREKKNSFIPLIREFQNLLGGVQAELSTNPIKYLTIMWMMMPPKTLRIDKMSKEMTSLMSRRSFDHIHSKCDCYVRS